MGFIPKRKYFWADTTSSVTVSGNKVASRMPMDDRDASWPPCSMWIGDTDIFGPPSLPLEFGITFIFDTISASRTTKRTL